jgi:hypothetical protein
VEFPFRFSHTFSVVWTVTTASGNATVLTQTFTVRSLGWNRERAALLIPERAHRLERTDLFSPGLVPARRERLQLATAFSRAHRLERVAWSTVEGLPVGYYRKEKVQLLAASLVDLPDFLSFSYEVGDPHRSELGISLEVEGLDPTEMGLALEVNSAKTETEMGLSLQVGVPEEAEVPISLEVGEAEASELALAFEEEGAGAEPLVGEAHQRNEARRAEEED